MFPNLRAEMARNGLDGEVVSKVIGCTRKSFSNKLTGKTEFTRIELFRIKKEFFPECSLEYLFDEKKSTAS